MRFCGFGGKMRFCGKIGFSVLAGNCVFAGKRVLQFWRKNLFCSFGGKTYFTVLAEERILRFWRETHFTSE